MLAVNPTSTPYLQYDTPPRVGNCHLRVEKEHNLNRRLNTITKMAINQPCRYLWKLFRQCALTLLSFLLLLIGTHTAADEGDASYEKMGDIELSQRAANLDAKIKTAEERAEVYTNIKTSIESAVGRLSQVVYPGELTTRINELREKLNSDKQLSSQPTISELRDLYYLVDNKLTSITYGILGFRGSNPSLKSDLTLELFSDIEQYDVTIDESYASSSEAMLSKDEKKDMLTKLDLISEQNFNNKKLKLKEYLNKKLTEANSLFTAQQTTGETYKKQLGLIYSALDKKKKAQSQIDEALVSYGIPAIALTMIVLLITPILYRKDKSQEYILNSGLLVQIFTIFLLTSTILVLGFAGKIDSNSLGTLLGGISGFVLGRNSSSGRRSNEDEQ